MPGFDAEKIKLILVERGVNIRQTGAIKSGIGHQQKYFIFDAMDVNPLGDFPLKSGNTVKHISETYLTFMLEKINRKYGEKKSDWKVLELTDFEDCVIE